MPTASTTDEALRAPESIAPVSRVRSERIASLDIVRGLAMVLMAIDHVRVYSGLPAGGPTAGIFFTRWVTHFAAPAFVFLAGTAAFLHGRKLGDLRLLRRYLVTRGLVLIALELTVIRFAWTFNFDYASYTLAGVIWMLGVCMILLAGLLRFSSRTIGIFGVVVILAQQLVALRHWRCPSPCADPSAGSGSSCTSVARYRWAGTGRASPCSMRSCRGSA